jgi:rhodanese-related sulfurtransferase
MLAAARTRIVRYSSSLAAASLVGLGVDAGDLDGGFERWGAEGFPVR